MNFVRPGVALAVVLGGLLFVARADAALLPVVGTVVSERVALFDKAIPLPPGEWRVASTGFGRVTGEDPGPYGTVGGVLLVRAQPTADRAFLLIHTNALPVQDGWGTSSVCTDPSHLELRSIESREARPGCSFVAAVRGPRRLGGTLPALSGKSGTERTGSTAALPQWALMAGFRVSDRRDFVDLRFGFAPPYPDPSGWFAPKDTLEEPRQQTVQRLAAWAQAAGKAARTALRLPPTQMQTLPAPPLRASDGPAPAATEDGPGFTRRALLATSYRVLSATTSFVIASTLTGNALTGGWITLWQSLTHGAVFIANEYTWEWPRRVQVHDLVRNPSEAGPEGPRAPTPVSLVLAGKPLQLPAGSWATLAEGADGGVDGGVSSIILGQIEGRHLISLLIVRTNTERTAAMIGPPAECARQDIYFAVVRSDAPRDGYCSYGKLVIPNDQAAGDPLWGGALDKLRLSKIDVPVAMMAVGARARTVENFLDVRVYFATDASAVMSRDRLEGDRPMQIRIDALRAWSDLLDEPLTMGVRGREPIGSVAIPPPWPAMDVEQALIAQTRAPLQALRQEGALDEAGYQRQVGLAEVAGLRRDQERWSLWTRSMYKAATYRAATYVDSFAVAWALTGDIRQSLGFANFSGMLTPVVAYANEMGWGDTAKAQPLPPNFPEIGLDRH
jgi:uncharacterized membrane protein